MHDTPPHQTTDKAYHNFFKKLSRWYGALPLLIIPLIKSFYPSCLFVIIHSKRGSALPLFRLTNPLPDIYHFKFSYPVRMWVPFTSTYPCISFTFEHSPYSGSYSAADSRCTFRKVLRIRSSWLYKLLLIHRNKHQVSDTRPDAPAS